MVLLTAIAHSKSVEIVFHEIDNLVFEQIKMPKEYKFRIGSFYRLLIPEIIGTGIAVYLDCDILCLADVNDLREQIYEDDNYIACVVQDSYVKLAPYLKKILHERGFSHTRYFNSGVIIFNCEKINKCFNSFSKTLIKICHDTRCSPFIDQDALDFAFKNTKIKWMDVDYNYMMNLPLRFTKNEQQLEKKILHFAGIKPWMAPELPPSIMYANHYKTVMHIKEKIGL